MSLLGCLVCIEKSDVGFAVLRLVISIFDYWPDCKSLRAKIAIITTGGVLSVTICEYGSLDKSTRRKEFNSKPSHVGRYKN